MTIETPALNIGQRVTYTSWGKPINGVIVKAGPSIVWVRDTEAPFRRRFMHRDSCRKID